jgi:hypothetical protein
MIWRELQRSAPGPGANSPSNKKKCGGLLRIDYFHIAAVVPRMPHTRTKVNKFKVLYRSKVYLSNSSDDGYESLYGLHSPLLCDVIKPSRIIP